MANVLKMKLIKAGNQAEVVVGGKDAIAALDKNKYSLVMLDLMMPKFDGFKVLESMKENGNKTPVFVLSNLSQPEDEKRARALGAKEYFVKSDISLTDVVKKILDAVK